MGYVAYWSQDPSFTQTDSIAAGFDTAYTAGPNPLTIGATYHWRVEARDRQGNTRWSDPPAGWSFFVVDNSTPVLIAPRAVAREDGILISWRIQEATGVSGVRVYRATGPGLWQGISPVLPVNGPAGQYLDPNVLPGRTYEYEIEAYGPGGAAGRFGPASAEMTAPPKLDLRLQPNPGGSTVTMLLALPRSGDVGVKVFDVQGREVARWSEPDLPAGRHPRTWLLRDAAGRELPGGTYFFRLESGAEHAQARWTVLR